MQKARNTQLKRKPRKQSVMPKELNPSASQFRGETHLSVRLRTAPALQTTTITTGVIANKVEIDPTALITGWSTRFASTFQEYRLIKARAIIRPVSQSTGTTRFWFDSYDPAAVPTQNQASEKVGIEIPNTNANSKAVSGLVWKQRGVNALSWYPIASGGGFTQFSIFTNAATYGAPVAVTSLFTVSFELTVEFRGLNST